MTVFCLAVACSSSNDSTENKPDQPTPTPVDGTSFTIPASGGTITKGDITFNFPNGTFDKDIQVSVNTTGSPATVNDVGYSDFYKVSIGGNTNKKITVSIKGEANVDAHMVVSTDGWNRHENKTSVAAIPLLTTYSNGVYTAELPLMQGDEKKLPSFTVGLVNSPQYNGESTNNAPPTRSDSGVDTGTGTETGVDPELRFTVDWYRKSDATRETIISHTRNYATEAVKIIEDLGFRLPGGHKIPIIITKDVEKAWGECFHAWYGKGYYAIHLNEPLFLKLLSPTDDDIMQLKQTLVHEMLHYYTSYAYDPRWAITIARKGVDGDPWTLLEEASGAWIEKYTGDHRLGDNCPTNAKVFMRNFIPANLDCATSISCGYGMGLALEYFSKRHDDKSILKLFEYKRDEKASTLRECFDLYLKEEKDSMFTYWAYREFVEEVINYRIDKRVGLSTLAEPTIIRIGGDGQTTSKAKAYKFGILVNKFYIGPNNNLTNKELSIKQKNPDLITKVYEEVDSVVTLLGSSTNGQSFTLTGNLDNFKNAARYLILTCSKSNVQEEEDSEVILELSDPAPTLSLPQSPVEFSAEGGEKTVTVTSNCTDLSIVSHPSWCSARIEDNVLYLNATKNDEENERSGEVKVKATNSRGSIEAAVKVKQNKTFAGFMEYAGVIVHLSYGSSIQPYPGYLRGRVAYCTPYIDKDGNGIITSSGSYSTTVDGNRYEKWGQRYHTYEEDNVTWDISLTVSLGGEHPKIINGHVYSLSERKVNEDVEWEDSNGETFKSSHYTKWVYETSFDISNLDKFILDYSSQRNSYDDDYRVWCNGYQASATSLDKFTTHVRNFKRTMDVTSNNSGFEPKHEDQPLSSNASLYTITVGLWKDDHWHEPVGK